MLPIVREKVHLDYLDSLRGVAIMGVVLVHSAALTRQHGIIMELAFTGQRGVELFYMISAFTLCLSLDSKKREERPLLNYGIRRFFRIAPLFYAVLLINLVLKYLSPQYSSLRNLGPLDVILGFFFLNGARPHAINDVVVGGWSIAVETSFYVLLPFLHKHFNSVRRTLLLFVVSAPVLGLGSWYLAHKATNSVTGEYLDFFWFPVQFPIFVLGMLAYYIWKDYIKPYEKEKMVSALLITGSAVIYLGCLPFSNRNLYGSSFLFLPLMLGLSIYTWPILVNPLTRFIGTISYSMYLLHFFVIMATDLLLIHLDDIQSHIYGHPAGLALIFLFVMAASIPVCYLSWRFIEQLGIETGRRLIAHIAKPKTARETV